MINRRVSRFGPTFGLVGSLVTMALVVACSPATGPLFATTTPTPTVVGTEPAPKVTHPLDVARFVAAPCLSIASGPRQPLWDWPVYADNVRGTPVAGSIGRGCEWRSPARHTDLTVTWLTDYPDGLNHLYARWTTFARWSPKEIEGMPTVFATHQDRWDEGIGDLYVAVSDQVVCLIHFSDPTGGIPSTSLEIIAGWMLSTVRSGVIR